METIEISQAGEGEKGFSLLELLIVLSLLGSVSAIVLPAIGRGLAKLEVRRSALELAAAARELRGRAAYQGKLQALILNPKGNSYEVPRGRVDLPPDVSISVLAGGEPLAEGMRRFHFFPNGRMVGGEIGIWGRDGSPSYVVRFDPVSGRIAVARE